MQADAPILTDRGWAMWLAGVMDCEGSFQTKIQRRSQNKDWLMPSLGVTLVIRMTTGAVISRVVQITTTGRVHAFSATSGPNGRPGLVWEVQGQDAALICGRLLPYLQEKSRQALLVIAAVASQRDHRGKRYNSKNPRPPELVAYQQALAAAMHILNARGGSAHDGLELDQVVLDALLAGPDAWAESGLSVPCPVPATIDQTVVAR